MESIKLKNNERLEIGQKQRELVERIYKMLNQGGLFEIYQILEDLNDDEDRKHIEQVFIARYDFNFLNYI